MKSDKKIKIGITGSTGVLGNILIKKLSEKKYQNISCFNGDIQQKNDITKWLTKNKCDVIIHFAAMVPTDKVENDSLSAYSVNVGGTINLLSAIKTSQHKTWLFYASSSHVYKSSSQPINEDSEIKPVSLYGMTKFMGERICEDAGKNENYNVTPCLGRIFSFYHSTQIKPFLYPSIIERLNTENLDKPFFLYGANSERDLSNAEEITDSIIALMEHRAEGIVNIGSGKASKIRDFVQSLTEKKLQIETDEKKDYLVADTSKLNKILSQNAGTA